jgi:hypothetical protein
MQIYSNVDGIDNKYIENAIEALSSSVGIKEHVDSQNIISLISANKVKEAITEIAKYLGLPIEINLSYVPKGYRPSANDGFQSNSLVKTDWRGRGAEGITAQVSIPSNLPFYGTPGMVKFPINVRVSEGCNENPMTLISVLAHEISHIVLYSIWHKEKDNEFYTDLTAMILGFAIVMSFGRKIVKTNSSTQYGFLSNTTTTTTNTTTYGYLSDENFDFALDKIEGILMTYRGKLEIKISGLEKKLREQIFTTLYFKKYIQYVDKHLKQNISKEDGHMIASFHQANYTDEFESAIRRMENELKQFATFVRDLDHFSDYNFKEIKKWEETLQSIGANLDTKYYRLRGAVIVLRKYVSLWYKIQYICKIKPSIVK